MQNQHSLAQAKAILSKDVIERSDSTFVYKSSKNRIGWEGALPQGNAYSSYLLQPKDTREALANAYRHASNMLCVMGIPSKLTIEVSHMDDSGWTDSKRVHVSTKYFDLQDLTVGQKMDIFTGLAVHEGCHILHTDFKTLAGLEPFTSQLQNIIEDERIEHLCGEETPGLANFLSMTKWYFFSEYERLNPEAAAGRPADEAARLVNAVIKLIRYRPALSDEDIRDFADPLIEIHDCMMPYPMTPEQTIQKAKEVEAILKKYLKQPPRPQPQDGPGGQGQDGDAGKQQPGSGSSQDQKDSRQQPSASGGQAHQKDSEKGTESSSGQPDGDPSPDGLGLTDSEIKAILEQMAEKLDAITGNQGKNINEEDECAELQDDENLNKVLSGKYETSAISDTFFEKMDSSRDSDSGRLYRESLERIKPYIPAMRGVLRANSTEERRTLTGLRSGMLDTNLLATAYQGVQTVYRQNETVKADPIAVCVLIDQSGSMYGERIEKAKDMAILIDSALEGLHGIDLFMYGFTTDEDGTTALLSIYRDRQTHDRTNLGMISATECTPIGEALLASAQRIRRQTSSKCLLFMLTDGSTTGEVPVKKAVEKLEDDNFIPIAIDIISNPRDTHGLEDNFKKVVKVTDIKYLPRELGKLIQKAILENSHRQVWS